MLSAKADCTADAAADWERGSVPIEFSIISNSAAPRQISAGQYGQRQDDTHDSDDFLNSRLMELTGSRIDLLGSYPTDPGFCAPGAVR